MTAATSHLQQAQHHQSVSASTDTLPPKQPGSPQKQPRFRSRYISEVQSIMYTCGDIKQPSHDTAQLIEVLVHDFLQRLLRALAFGAVRRGAKTVGPEDLLFLIRHDGQKLSRLREYLQWREVRKMSNSSGGGNSGQASSSVVSANADDPLLEEVAVVEGTSATTATTTQRRVRSRLPWALSSTLDLELLSQACQDGDDHLLDYIDDTIHDDTRYRLADALTRSMSRAEYLEWTECRQASFTYKKAKKFREWLGPTAVTDYRVGDELLEMFGLLAFIFVELLTTAALSVDPVAVDDGGREGDASMFAVSLFSKPSAKMALSVEQVKTAFADLLQSDPTLKIISLA